MTPRLSLHRVSAITGFLLLAMSQGVAMAADPTPLYYQDPDNKPFYSLTPKKTGDGRDFKPVYKDGETTADKSARTKPATTASVGKGKILYYRNPMGLPDTSPMPKKDSMGMDYIPVYENEASGEVQVSPGKLQLLGVRTAPVELRKTLARTIRATGTVQLNERTLAVLTTRVGGWIDKLHVSAAGDAVKRGDPLIDLYAPDLVAAEEEYLVAARIAAGHAGDSLGGPHGLLDAAAQRLRVLGVPDDELKRLKRTGIASRVVTLRAPADGIVIEKTAVQGMRVERETMLYKTADLSTLWLTAQVQERDLGSVMKGQTARASFVALPGRSFEGSVDFIYPTLSPETRTAQVRIILPNPDLALRADMYAAVEIETPAAAGQVLAVPDSAVIDSGTKQVVLIERGEGRFAPRAVKLGARGDGYAEIREGVKAGERVVTGANFLIDAESNLRAALQAFSTGGDTQ